MRFGEWECWKSNRIEGRSGLGIVERSFFSKLLRKESRGRKAGSRPAEGRRPFPQSRLKAGGVEAALKRPSFKAGGL